MPCVHTRGPRLALRPSAARRQSVRKRPDAAAGLAAPACRRQKAGAGGYPRRCWGIGKARLGPDQKLLAAH